MKELYPLFCAVLIIYGILGLCGIINQVAPWFNREKRKEDNYGSIRKSNAES